MTTLVSEKVAPTIEVVGKLLAPKKSQKKDAPKDPMNSPLLLPLDVICVSVKLAQILPELSTVEAMDIVGASQSYPRDRAHMLKGVVEKIYQFFVRCSKWCQEGSKLLRDEVAGRYAAVAGKWHIAWKKACKNRL